MQIKKAEGPETALIKQQVSKAITAAELIQITNQTDLTKAVDVLSRIKQVGKLIQEAMNAPIKVAYAAYKEIKAKQEAIYGEYLARHEQAEKIVKDKMLAFQRMVEEERRKEEARLAARVEKGTMKFETAVAKMEALPDVPKTAEGKLGSISTRKIKKFEITEESKLPREFLIPDTVKIRQAVMAGQEIPGIRVYEEEIIAAR